MATAYLRVSLLMGIPIPHTLVQTSKISVGSLSKIVAALYITGRDSRLKSVIAHPRCLIKKEGGLTNAHFHKNKKREDIKSHHYIISYDPADVTENGLTGERAQAISLDLAKQMFPGYQAIVRAFLILSAIIILYASFFLEITANVVVMSIKRLLHIR